ncbi:MAG: D-alanine--D-alanine ligase [Chitinophagaceae bacterium]|nr:D-alanine--D-alanine ligase [Chitinophagaceae bacterium]
MGRPVINPLQRILHRPFFIKLLYWEYWHMTAVYALIYPVFLWLCIRCGFKYFFTAANPGIRYGGFLMESKKEIYDLLPENLYPKTILVKAGTESSDILDEIKRSHFSFPLIAKPDIGMRGLAAKKLETEEEVTTNASKFGIDFLIQEFVSFKNEVGIFYYRYPGQLKGSISGIAGKEFLSITGDGKSSVWQLLQHDKRYILQLDSLNEVYGSKLGEVLKAGEMEVLVPYGNHARGSKFLDYSHLIDEELVTFIDKISQRVPGFFYGRLDLRYNDWDELKQGKNFSIIELNGAGSEPTHIYDPKHSLLFAWKEIIRHWIILWRISRKNHKQGFPYMTFHEGAKMFRDHKAYVTKLQAVHDLLLKTDR